MAIYVIGQGPAFVTDLQPVYGGFMADYGSNDTISYAWNTTDMTVTIHGGNDSVTTGYGNDVIYDDPQGWPANTGLGHPTSSGNDVIHAQQGSDTIYAGDGHNTYDGGTGTDTVN